MKSRAISNSMTHLSKSFLIAILSASLVLIAGCTTPRTKPAVVTDRSGGAPPPAATEQPTPPGYYRVKKGDTLARIALDHGQAPRDVTQWNKAANPNFNPNVIEVGDLILISLRDFEDGKADVLHKYSTEEARSLQVATIVLKYFLHMND